MTKYARDKDGCWIDVFEVPKDFPDFETLNRCLGGSGGGFKVVPDAVLSGDFVVGENGFSPRDTQAPAVASRWNEYEFRKRFTAAERIRIAEATAASAALRDFDGLLQAAGRSGTNIVSNDADLIAGMNALKDAGLLTQERRDEILT